MSANKSVAEPVSIGAQPKLAFTSGNAARGRRAPASPGLLVRLSARELAVASLVAQLGQLTTRQIGDIEFAGLRSATPLKRTLRRLAERRVLDRLGLRVVGGTGGGSSWYVYQLGNRGGKLLGLPREYPRYSEVSNHMLDVSECLARLKRLEHANLLEILCYQGEDAAYREVGGTKLTPDLFVDFGVPATQRRFSWWVEMDRGTEHNTRQIPEKCERYGTAYQSGLWKGGVYPRVVFVVLSERRQRFIERAITSQPKELRQLFQTCLLESFPQSLLTGVEMVDFKR